jgi:hypothetical protein
VEPVRVNLPLKAKHNHVVLSGLCNGEEGGFVRGPLVTSNSSSGSINHLPLKAMARGKPLLSLNDKISFPKPKDFASSVRT